MVMVNSFYGRGSGRFVAIAVVLVLLTGILLFSTGTDSLSSLRPSSLWTGPGRGSDTTPVTGAPAKDEPKKDAPKKDEPKKDAPKKDEPKKDAPKKEEPKKDEPKKDAPKKDKPAGSSHPKGISYDVTTPPTVGCEDLVNDLQQELIRSYTKLLKGVRYANIWGYLETENKGDAAIWTAQQILLTMLGIETMDACRFVDKDCDIEHFRAVLDKHSPHSAIIMAGGGNFNDYYWEDQPSRMKMIETFPDTPVRAFPQSIYMTNPERISATKEAFAKHKDLQLASRDKPSYDFLEDNFKSYPTIKSVLVPDIAFMWGNRPDFRTETNKTHDILILARKDMEVSAGNSESIPFGEGNLDLGGSIGNVTYNKVDWKFTDTPDINGPPKPKSKNPKRAADPDVETGKNQRAWAKSIAGFELLGSARFVITDRLHGHILSTLIGVPHVLLDSKLGKNLNLHDTWTKDCACTRIAKNIDEAQSIARLFFEAERKD